MLMTWIGKEPKKVIIKENGISATFHFSEGISYNITDKIAEQVLRKKLSDAIATGKIKIGKGSSKKKDVKDEGNEVS